MISIDKVIKSFKQALKEIYAPQEITAIIELVFEYYLGFSKTDFILNLDKALSDFEYSKLNGALERLRKHEPVQYILGETYFYNLKLKVRPGVLIPRQETEELIDWIVKENSKNTKLQVLDIGTGSGCIAISLAANLPNAEVTAFDISELALEIASNNAELNQVKVGFEKFDILAQSHESNERKFDIIVSNPPYILEKEKILMQKNVLDFEPELALFVDDRNPLIFYQAIVDYSIKHLKTQGKLYFEINEAFGNQVDELLVKSGFGKVELRKDINGKDRMISGVKL